MLKVKRKRGITGSVGARLVAAPLGLVAVTLLAGGIRLVMLGGSPYYLLAGLACLTVACGLWRGHALAGTGFALFLAATLAWAIAEAGLAPWPLVARLCGPAVFGLLIALVVRGRGRFAALAASVLCLALVVAAFLRPHPESIDGAQPTEPARPAAVAQADWLNWGNDPGGSRYSPATDITPENAPTLQAAWVYHVGPAPAAQALTFEGVPIEADGLVTLCAPNNDVVALDAATGKPVWRWLAHTDMRGVVASTCRGVARHVAPRATGPCATRIITATLDARMIALDALTGKPCQDFGRNGVIDLTEGLGNVPKGYYYVTSAPAIIGDKAMVGGWVKDGQSVGEPSGVVRAFDVRTGKLAWAWDMGRPDRAGLPGPTEEYTRGTPNSWAPISVDEQLGLVYLPTGNAGPDYTAQQRRPFDEKYSSAVVALDGATGQPRWSFQTAHHDMWDYDVASQPVLFDLPTPQGPVPALALGTKRAQLFILDRRTGRPLRQVSERAVSTQAAPGERPSPTQPFSTGMPDFAGPELTEARMWGITPIDQMICRILFRKAEYRGPATPIQLSRKTIIYPGYLGGMNWGSVSVDPARQLLVLATNRFAMYDQLLTRQAADKRGLHAVASGMSADLSGPQPMDGTPYGADIAPFLSPLGVPCQQPPYAMIHAVDLRTGRIVWQHPFGTTRNAGPFGLKIGLPLPMGVPFSGGSILTATGLTFVAASQDGQIRALETGTGRELWHAPLPFGGQSTPMTYKLKGGRQYVVIVAGGSKGMNLPHGDAVVAFALPH